MRTIAYIALLLFIGIIFLMVLTLPGCTTQTGGEAQKINETREWIDGFRMQDHRATTITLSTSGEVTLVESKTVATSQPSSVTIKREAATTKQPSVSTTGDVKGSIEGAVAGELGDFKFEGIQKSWGNIALAVGALICAAGFYFLLKPPKNWIAVLLCVAVAVLSMLMPWVLSAIALGIIVLVGGYWAVTHVQELKQHRDQLIGSVKNIIDGNPDRADEIRDAAARAQVDPKLKAAVKAA